MTTFGEALRRGAQRLAGKPTAMLDARALMKHAAGVDDATLIACERDIVSAPTVKRFDSLIERRAGGEPVSAITGLREFWGMEFRVLNGVLAPRPDSETLIEALLARLPDRARAYRAVDLGVGSGCLLAAVLREYPNARGLGVDLDAAALAVARGNLDRLGLASRARLRAGDWLDGVAGGIDILTANPPYIPDADRSSLDPEVVDHENSQALFGGADGLDAYRRIIPALESRLAAGGIAVFEVGRGQASAVAEMAGRGFTTAICNDLAGVPRAVVLSHPKKALH